MYNRTTELGWGTQGPEQDRPRLPSTGPTTPEQTAFSLWAGSTMGEMNRSAKQPRITPHSQAGLSAAGNTGVLHRALTSGPLKSFS